MDQKQTGRFIAERRRELGLTQKELAEKLGITDRADYFGEGLQKKE